jgi:DNA repair photolyase
MAPVIPVVTDGEIESLLARAAEAGATHAGYILLRLPLELKELFREWLEIHAPLKANHVFSRLQDAHGGKSYRAEFGLRHSGSGPYADMIRQRFRLAAKRHGLNAQSIALDTRLFQAPRSGPIQTCLF